MTTITNEMFEAISDLRAQGLGWRKVSRQIGASVYAIRRAYEPGWADEQRRVKALRRKRLVAASKPIYVDPVLSIVETTGLTKEQIEKIVSYHKRGIPRTHIGALTGIKYRDIQTVLEQMGR